jgi:hypothetical protein
VAISPVNAWDSILADCAALAQAEGEPSAIPLDGNDPLMETYNFQLRAALAQLRALAATKKLILERS